MAQKKKKTTQTKKKQKQNKQTKKNITWQILLKRTENIYYIRNIYYKCLKINIIFIMLVRYLDKFTSFPHNKIWNNIKGIK